jgi:hypothetical protein
MEKRRKCPWLKKCDPDCVFYRKGLRYFEAAPGGAASKPIPFEECAINIGVDCLEQLVGRSIGQQKATEENRNETHELLGFFQGMAALKGLENKSIKE